MANSIKYNTGTEANALSIGNFHMGVGDVNKGPTSTTGFHNGINPPPGGYTIYIHNKNIGPSIQRAFNDAELIRITNTIASTSYTTINECFSYFDGQVDKMVVDQSINYVVTDELVLDLNAGIIPSYPRSGTSWKDLSGGGNNGTLVNNPDFNSNETFTVNSGGTGNERIDIAKPSQLATDQYLTIQILFKLNTLPTAQYGTNTPILGARVGSDYMIFAYPQVDNKSHLGVSYDDSRFRASHESVFETEAGRWVHFTHVGIPYVEGGYQRGKLMYYINGVLDRDEFISGDSNGWSIPNPFYVGYDARWFVYSDVDVATIKMYNKQLTADEISANYFQAPIVTDGLVGAFDAGNLVSYENGSTTAYSLTGSLSGTLLNGVGFSGDYGGMFVLDGVDDDIDFGNPSSLSNSQVTVTFWYNPTAIQNNTHGGIINGRTPNGRFCLFWYGTDQVSIQYRDDSGLSRAAGGVWTRTIAPTPVSTTDQWYFIQITGNEDTNEWRVGVDLDVSTSSFGSQYVDPDSNQWLLGRRSSAAYDYSKIANLQIYDRILSQEEIVQNYSAGKGRFGA